MNPVLFYKTPSAFFPLTLTLLLILHASLPSSHAQGKKDAWLKKMAPMVKPTPFTKSSLGAVQKRMIKAISVVERADRTDGPKPNELITRACESHPGNGSIRTIVTTAVIEQTYEDAMYLGLFDKKGKFSSTIKNGPNAGEKIKFEYIVPAEKAPEFSQDIANIRLIRSGQGRQSASLSPPEERHLVRLNKIKLETRSRLVLQEKQIDHMLDTSHATPDKGPHYEKWEASMELAGKKPDTPPQLKLEARKRASASRSNGEKLSIWVKLKNLKRTPTKVTVHCYMLGRTERERVLFNIGQSTKEVVLLPSDKQQMLFYSRPFPSMKNHVADLDKLPKKQRGQAKFFVRGWVVRVEHNGKVVNTGASMPSLLPYADKDFKRLIGLP